MIPQSQATMAVEAEEMLVHTLTGTKRKAEEELKEESPSNQCCLESHEVQPREQHETNTTYSSVRRTHCSFSSVAVPSPPDVLFPGLSGVRITPVDHLIVVNRSREDFNAKYVESRELGAGGFGVVLSGIRLADNKDVAIKHIPRKKVKYTTVKFQDQYSLEISEVVFMVQAAGQLCQGSVSNPGVIGLVDVFEFESEVLIIMERSCREVDMSGFYLLKDKHIPEHEAKIIWKQLVDVCIRMHQNGVFHRDIKGGNILVSIHEEDRRVKVIDFGCAAWVTENPYEKYAGTKHYAPPEHLLQHRYQAEQTTVWQIGRLLWRYYCETRFNLKEFIRNPNLPVTRLSVHGKHFLKRCLTINHNVRPRLEELKLHPWLN